MRIVSADELARIFDFPALVEALREAFRAGAVTPPRHDHSVNLPGEPAATLLLMPAWQELKRGDEDGFLGVKIVALHPGNAARGRPSLSGAYLLMAARTGEPLALIDGPALTLWRTAAASALAASYLAREEARRLLMVGAGALAPYLIEAHASLRPVAEVMIWNHRHVRAEQLAASLAARRYSVRAVEDLETAVRDVDIISCATLSSQPLVRGEWLKPGVHLDLVGGFTPDMRECDDEAVQRARVFVDTCGGALKEAGDIIRPLADGAITDAHVRGDLFDLCRGTTEGRNSEDEITLFKSVGTALEDLAAASFAYSKLRGRVTGGSARVDTVTR